MWRKKPNACCRFPEFFKSLISVYVFKLTSLCWNNKKFYKINRLWRCCVLFLLNIRFFFYRKNVKWKSYFFNSGQPRMDKLKIDKFYQWTRRLFDIYNTNNAIWGKTLKKRTFFNVSFSCFLKVSSTLGWAWSIQESINGRINVSIRRH